MLLPRSPPDAAAAPPPRVPTIADPLNERELLLRPPDRPGQTERLPFCSNFTRGCPTLSPECESSAAAVNARTQLPHEYLCVSPHSVQMNRIDIQEDARPTALS